MTNVFTADNIGHTVTPVTCYTHSQDMDLNGNQENSDQLELDLNKLNMLYRGRQALAELLHL